MDNPFRFNTDQSSGDQVTQRYSSSRRSSILQDPSYIFQSNQSHADPPRTSRPRPRICPTVPKYRTSSPPPSDRPSTTSYRFMDLSHTLKRRSAVSTSTFRDFEAEQNKRRKVITPRQFDRLLEVFAESDTPCWELRDRLGSELGMSNREVQVWFQNRRAKVKRERQMQSTTSHSTPVHEAEQDRSSSTLSQLKWRHSIVSPVVPHGVEARSISSSDRITLELPRSSSRASTPYTQAPREGFTYQNVSDNPRTSIPLPVLDPSANSSPRSAASSTISGFGTRSLPNPSIFQFNSANSHFGSYPWSNSTHSTRDGSPSPWTALDKLSLHAPSSFTAEHAPFFRHNLSEQSPSPEEEEGPIHLAPIIESVVSSTSSLISNFGSTAHFPHSTSNYTSQTAPSSSFPASSAPQPPFPGSRRPSLDLLLNPLPNTPPSPPVGTTSQDHLRSNSSSSLAGSGSRKGVVEENYFANSAKPPLSLPSIQSLSESV